jgi:hypothetical protein
MKKNSVVIFFVIITFIFDFYIPAPYQYKKASGLYNIRSGMIWTTEKSELHEIGHKLDYTSGLVSENPEFQSVVERMALDLRENSQEDYAAIYYYASGNKDIMPSELRNFYDWELSEKLLQSANNAHCYIDLGSSKFIHFLCGAK